MKKVVIILFCLLLICGCEKEKEKEKKEEIIKPIEGSVQYVIFREKNIYFYEDFTSYIKQFVGLGCNFVSRNSSNDKILEIDKYNENKNEFNTINGSNYFVITCPFENTYTSSSFSGYFKNKDDKPYKDKKNIEWHLSTTKEEAQIFINENTTIKLGGDNTDSIKTLKEKLGQPSQEVKTIRGYIDKLVYSNDKISYEYGVMDPGKSNDGNIYSLYVTKK